MPWSYDAYVLSNFGIALGIFVVISGILVFIINSKYDDKFIDIVTLMFDIELYEPPSEQVPEKENKDASTQTQKQVEPITTRYVRNVKSYEVYSYKVWFC
jgi:hypothetical protein